LHLKMVRQYLYLGFDLHQFLALIVRAPSMFLA
jgi:hypothetical protein